MADRPFDRLLGALGPSVERRQLLDALYLIRAPRTLVGVVPAARQFQDYRRDYPALSAFDGRDGYADTLDVLDKIAALPTDDEILSGAQLGHYRAWTPLRPITGDSVIGELLLIRAGGSVPSEDFEQLLVWLLWQAIRFQHRTMPAGRYEAYLGSEDSLLHSDRHGSRLYQAYLALQRFARGRGGSALAGEGTGQSLPPRDWTYSSDHLHELVGLLQTDEGSSIRLAQLVTLGQKRNANAAGLFRAAQEKLGLSEEALRAEVGRVARLVPEQFGLLLRTIWAKELRVLSVRRGTHSSGKIRWTDPPKITYGPHVAEVLKPTDEGGVHSGIAIDFFGLVDDVPWRKNRDGLDDDPPETTLEPKYSLFLAGKDDFIQGYYAARGQQNADEYRNARLPWNRSMLSQQAIREVCRLVTAKAKDPLDLEARLAIGLSLLSGRPIGEVACAPVVDGEDKMPKEASVAISRSDARLLVRAGKPDLRKVPKPSKLYRPRSELLVLPLPEDWRPLVPGLLQDEGQPAPARTRSIASVEKRAVALLRSVVGIFHVTATGVREALPRAFDRLTQGDLGALAALTAGSEANARNVIHYASFERSQLEGWWRRAAEQLVGPLPERQGAPSTQGWSGSQHAFDPKSLAEYFEGVKARLREAIAARQWLDAYNLSTFYLSRWLGLGLAQRRTLDPVPAILLEGGLALVADKHRSDGSTDRLVPITRSLRRQLEAHVALANQFTSAAPGLDPLVATERGIEIRLRYAVRSKRSYRIAPYAPKRFEDDGPFPSLPANFGRKIARSWSAALSGRLKDAELGHWVRGRHAWDAASTLDAQAFRDEWIKLQEEFEAMLGFEPIIAAFCEGAPRPTPVALPPSVRPQGSRRIAPSEQGLNLSKLPDGVEQDRLDEIAQLGAVHRERNRARASKKAKAVGAGRVGMASPVQKEGESAAGDEDAAAGDFGAIALDFVRKTLDGLQGRPEEVQEHAGKWLSKWMRDKMKVPIFFGKPPRHFANPSILDAYGLQALAYLEANVLGAFGKDFARLPPRPKASGAATWAALESNERAELGRLVMIAIWRLGLQRYSLIEAFLRTLRDKAPILAQGPNRYLVMRVACVREGTSKQHVVILDDFTSAFLAVELPNLRRLLEIMIRPSGPDISAAVSTPTDGDHELDEVASVATLGEGGAAEENEKAKRHRPGSELRKRLQSCLHAYLKEIGAGQSRVPLSLMFAAAGQQLMAGASPIIAAYARGLFDTDDLGDDELRRLGGQAPARKDGPSNPAAPETRIKLASSKALPGNEIGVSVGILSVLTTHSSPEPDEWARLLKGYKPADAREELLLQFGIWLAKNLPQGSLKKVGRRASARLAQRQKLTPRHKLTISNYVRVVACALLGFTDTEDPGFRPVLDQDTLLQLRETSRDEFPDRLQHGAWHSFHRFLADPDADHAGFEIRALGTAPAQTVSARLIATSELERIHSLLSSSRSGIGNAGLRLSVRRHFELMATYGLRRSESAHLRTVDHQGDVIRVQAYGRHTLKTAWADRVLPVSFAEPQMRAWMEEAVARNTGLLIAGDPSVPVDEANFNDQLNRLIKAVTGQQSLGAHHVRHTLANRVLLTLLWEAAGLDGMVEDFPWLEGMRIPPERMQALLGPEGNGGQGLRALSALMGHAHPTTTLRNYIHTLCIARRGALDKLDQLDMRMSFAQRIASRATHYRHLVGLGLPDSESPENRRIASRMIRDQIETRFRHRGVRIDETPIETKSDAPSGPEKAAPTSQSAFEELEQLDLILRGERENAPEVILEPIRKALEVIARIPSGKKGSGQTRHPLERFEDGTPLPTRLAAGEATMAAVNLAEWLKELRGRKEEDFQWLLGKWLHASERERGRMALHGDAEVQRACGLNAAGHVRIEVLEDTSQTDRGGVLHVMSFFPMLNSLALAD